MNGRVFNLAMEYIVPKKIYQEGYMIESALENWVKSKQAIINIKIKGIK